MNPFNVLIIDTEFDEKGDEQQPNILFGPKLIFAETKKGAVKKAVILSGISAEKIEYKDIYVSVFDYISNYEEKN